MSTHMSQNPGSAAGRPTPGALQATEPARAPYAAPAVERLGAWSALTLQQSIPITLLSDPERTSRFG